jgi:L-threonylcarbamoyladenylate synthase
MAARYLQIDCIQPDTESIRAIAGMVASGGIVVYPTDTIYGIGCDAANAPAVEKVNRLKLRAPGRPLLVLIPGLDWITRWADEIPAACRKIISSCWPGPLTLILKASVLAPRGVLGDGRTIGLRWPDHPFLQALLDEVGTPIVSTSANISGSEPLLRPEDEHRDWLQNADMVVDGGPLTGKESTVLDFSGKLPKLLREGATSRAALEAILGPLP